MSSVNRRRGGHQGTTSEIEAFVTQLAVHALVAGLPGGSALSGWLNQVYQVAARVLE